MSSESIPANEYPDRVGFSPDNPYLKTFKPYIPAHVRLRELTPVPLIVGTLLGIVFGASSLYLVLKVGLTVSASIPVAVISITLFRALSKLGMRDATILENNIVQTAGSAGESIAFGVGVTMPAIMILGFDLEMTRVLLVSVLGGLLDDEIGSKLVIVGSLASMVAVGTTLLTLSGAVAFWICGLLLCLFIGPAQSSARTLMLRLAADGKEGVAFGLYTTTGRAASFLAPTLFATFISLFGSDRAGMGGLCVVLAAGLLAMVAVRVPRQPATR